MTQTTVPIVDGTDRVLTPEAIAFVEDLTRRFRPRIDELLEQRRTTQARFNSGARPGFLGDTATIRSGDWTVGSIPVDLQDRRVEITGPVDRKMIINALNSGANVYMADFEDANSPTWQNNIEGQINLKDRWAGKLGFTDPETKKRYQLAEKAAVLIVRPRGWHLTEDHLTLDGE